MSNSNVFGHTIRATISGAVGAFFLPAESVAAGGILNVMGACAIGSSIAYIPLVILQTPIRRGFIDSVAKGNDSLTALYTVLTAANVIGATFLAAKIGAEILMVASNPVFTCLAVGAIATSALSLLCVGIGTLVYSLTQPTQEQIEGWDADEQYVLNIYNNYTANYEITNNISTDQNHNDIMAPNTHLYEAACSC